MVVSIAAAAAAAAGGGSSWAPLHLALAGAATVAIGTFMPHFAVTLAGTRPSASRWRLAVVLALAAGSAAVVGGVTLSAGPSVGALGSALLLLGLAGVAIHTLAPLREPLARRHHVVTATYLMALVDMAAGVVLGGLAVAGVAPVVAAWATIRPAHAWLTLFGGVSLSILATLVYLAPTVFGARIRAGWGLAVAVAGMGLGPLIVVAGFAFDARVVVIGGMAATVAGGIGQVAYVLDARQRRGPYTSEHDWRSVAVWHLIAGTAWFVAASAAATVRMIGAGSTAGWSLGALVLPLVAGWMLQELVGSWTHLAPSVTPGGPMQHARQRRVMAVLARTRLLTWNLGLAVAWIGVWLGARPLAVIGGGLVALVILVSVAVLGRALLVR